MKTLSPLILCLCTVLTASPGIVQADDDTAPGQTAPSNGSTTGTPTAQQIQRMRQAFAQLDLTDEQKQQIKEIRQTVTDKVQRHQQVMAVLTPEQREKLRQIFQQYRSNGGATGSTSTGSAVSGNDGAGDGSDLAPGAN